MSVRVLYLCLQATRQGQASFAHVHEIADGLDRLGYRVTVFEPRYAGDRAPRPNAAGRLLEFIRVQARFVAALRPDDIVYVRDHPAALPAMWAARLRRLPVVLEVNAPWYELLASYPRLRPLGGLIGWTFRLRAAASAALITVTSPIAAWLRTDYRHPRVEVIPNGANVRLFHPSAERLSGLPPRYVTFFGALAPWQGIETIIAAVGSSRWPSDVSVVIAGEGVESERVLDAGRREPRIRYLGTLPYRAVPGLIGGSIAGLCPKTNTGADWSNMGLSPLKAYEILACGVPAIVSDFPGLADLVADNGAGAVVPAGDAEALAEAVRRFADDAQLCRDAGERGRECVVNEHSWDARAEATARVLGAVVRR